MDAAAVEAFVQYLQHQRLIVDYAHVAAFALLFYDYLLTVRLEVVLVWFSPWNYTKVLFILIRYIPMANAYFVLYHQMFLNTTLDMCTMTFPVSAWLIQTGMPIAEAVLAIRTWAVWHRNRTVGVGLLILVAGLFIPECIFIQQFIKSLKFRPAPYVGFRGCFIVSASKVIFINLLALTIIETVVLGLMAISAFRSYRSGNTNELSNIVHRDGVLFYAYLLVVTLANLVIMFTQPIDLQVVLVPMSSVLYSVLTTRIMINIRAMARRGTGETITELHHGYQKTEPATLPLAFRSGHPPENESDTVWTQTVGRSGVAG